MKGERKRAVEDVGERAESSRRCGQVEQKKGGHCLHCVRFENLSRERMLTLVP